MFIAQSPHARESMADTLDRLKLDLVSAYDHTGTIDIADWVRRHPSYRDELLDFWIWLKGTPRASGEKSDLSSEQLLDAAEVEVYEQLLHDACLAVTLGPGLLEPTVDPVRETLADELEAVRRRPRVRQKSVAFAKAVVFTWIVSELQPKRPRVTRLAVQKVMYVLEDAMSLGIFTEHERKRLGPYDHKARYRDAEPIAERKGWLRVTGTVLSLSGDVSEAWRYVGSYLRSESLARQLVDRLAGLSDDQLETVATVLPVARDIGADERRVTPREIADALEKIVSWKEKLTRPNFTEQRIEEALHFLSGLRLL